MTNSKKDHWWLKAIWWMIRRAGWRPYHRLPANNQGPPMQYDSGRYYPYHNSHDQRTFLRDRRRV